MQYAIEAIGYSKCWDWESSGRSNFHTHIHDRIFFIFTFGHPF